MDEFQSTIIAIARNVLAGNNSITKWKEITPEEIKVFFFVLFVIGIVKKPQINSFRAF